MSEEKQILQVKCEQAAAAISETVGHRCAVTLLAFYRHVGAPGMGFASSLADHESIAITLDATVSRSCGAPLPPRDESLWLPTDEEVSALADKCRTLLPFHSGFFLILGQGSDSSCATFEPEEHMRNFLAHHALPLFQQAATEQQSETTEAP